jgi:hypothetical protein
MKIYDTFIFFNELELLELRLMTLYNVVDYFVLVEAGTTFTGHVKKYYYENNKQMFEKYSDKIIHVKHGKLPFPVSPKNIIHGYSPNAWGNEFYNRDLISEGIISAQPDDYIMISDVDEIPNPKGIIQGINNNWDRFVMEQKLCYYYVNCLQNQRWHGTVVIKKKFIKTPQDVRNDERKNPRNIILDGGWHYSFLGDADKIRIKLNATAETQVNTSQINNQDHISKCLEDGSDLFFRDGDQRYIKKIVPINEIGHSNLVEWLIKYPNMIKV